MWKETPHAVIPFGLEGVCLYLFLLILYCKFKTKGFHEHVLEKNTLQGFNDKAPNSHYWQEEDIIPASPCKHSVAQRVSVLCYSRADSSRHYQKRMGQRMSAMAALDDTTLERHKLPRSKKRLKNFHINVFCSRPLYDLNFWVKIIISVALFIFDNSQKLSILYSVIQLTPQGISAVSSIIQYSVIIVLVFTCNYLQHPGQASCSRARQ